MCNNLKKRLLKDIHTSYVRKDIKDISRIKDIYGFNNLIMMLAGQIGNLVNIHELSVKSGLSINTVRKYLFVLEIINGTKVIFLPVFAL